MQRPVTEDDVHWTVSVLCQNPEIIENRERLYSALELPLSELQDLKTNLLLYGSGSDVFLRNTIMKWISRKGSNATFAELAQILNNENFKATADSIVTRVEGRINRVSLTSTSISVWFDVPPKILMFTGRVRELDDLHVTIMTQNAEGTVITTLSGLGGIGKTTLAIEYAWKYQSKFYTNVIWLNNETTTTLTDSLHRLAEKLRIEVLDSRGFKLTLERLILTMYDHFHCGNTLFIFDNVECFEDIKSYLPPVTPNKIKPFVLLTSRNRCWNRRVNVIVLDVFTEAESVDFLTKYLRLETESELSLAREISDILHHLPLGIRQAGAYILVQNEIRRTSMENQLKEYLIQWDQNFKAAMTYEYWRQTDDPYEKTTFVTWNVTLEKVKKVSLIAVHIMELISYLNSDNIPIELFYYLGKVESSLLNLLGCLVPSDVGESTVDEAIQILHSYSLVNLNEDKNTFNVHRLVQRVIKIQVESRLSSMRLKEARRLLEIPLQLKYFTNLEEMCLIHAKSILRHMKMSNLPLNAFQMLITTKQNNQVSEQLNNIMRTYKTFGCEAAFESFYEFDKANRLSRDSSEYIMYMEKYYGAFLDYIHNEIRKHCKYSSDTEIVRKLTEKARPIFREAMISAEVSMNMEILGSMLTAMLSCNEFGDTETKEWSFEILKNIINTYKTIIKYRRKKYFHAISVRGNILMLIRHLNGLGKIGEILGFIKIINDMLYDCPELNDSYVDTGLADCLIECRNIFQYEPVECELTLAELRYHEIVYERFPQRTQYSEILTSVRGNLKCLVQLDRFSDALEFISKSTIQIFALDQAYPIRRDKGEMQKLCDDVLGIACNPKCKNLRQKFYEKAVQLYNDSNNENRADYENYQLNTLRCSVALDSISGITPKF